MKVQVYSEICNGLASCVAIAPSVFQLDAENKARVLDPDSANVDTLMKAAQSCSYDAIILEDDAGECLYP